MWSSEAVGDAGGAGSGGQLLVFHPRGTRQDSGSGTCVLRCQELCLPSLLILTCPSAFALSGSDTVQSLRPRADACCVPGPGHVGGGRLRSWGTQVYISTSSWVEGFSEAQGRPRGGNERRGRGKGVPATGGLSHVSEPCPSTASGAAGGDSEVVQINATVLGLAVRGLARPFNGAAHRCSRRAQACPPGPGEGVRAPLSPVAGGSCWQHPDLGCRWAGFTSPGRGRPRAGRARG